VLSAQTTASPMTELHEVATGTDGAMVMRPKEGGFLLEPGAPHALAPGGDHIMIMGLAAPVRAGDSVEVTLTLDDGSTTTFTALAKDTTAGEENYEGGDMHMGGMSGTGQDG
jgi:copper(I)-binding protein